MRVLCPDTQPLKAQAYNVKDEMNDKMYALPWLDYKYMLGAVKGPQKCKETPNERSLYMIEAV